MTADLHKKKQTINRLERRLAFEKVQQRKKATRRKIELGGLVIKAKMDHYSKEIILGALLEAKLTLDNCDGAHTLFELQGKVEFMQYGDKRNGK